MFPIVTVRKGWMKPDTTMERKGGERERDKERDREGGETERERESKDKKER
jgi:hypothetical protein